jgi:hypothetical protein
MPDNYSVALGVHPPPAIESNQLNPVQIMEGLARVQNMQNQNLLFHQEFAAKTRLGEIMTAAPDLQTGYEAAMRDPIAAPFAPQAFSAYRQGLAFQRQYNESIGKDASSGLEAIVKATPMAITDPLGYEAYVRARFAVLPKDVQATALPGFRLYTDGLFGGMDGWTDEQKAAEITKRATSMGIGSGAITPQTVRNLNGQPEPGVEKVTLPSGREVPMVRTQPVFGGGSLQPLDLSGAGSVRPNMPPPSAPGAPQAAQPGSPASVSPTPGSPTAIGTARGLSPSEATIVPTLGQTTEEKGLAEKGTEEVLAMQKEISTAASAIPTMANRLDALQDALRGFPAGGWASGRQQIQTFMQGVGRALQIDPHTIEEYTKKVNGNIEDAQVFHALINQQAIANLKEVAQGTGRVMLPEVLSFMNAMSENTDPRAIERLLNTQGRRALQIAADKVNKFTPYLRAAQAGQVTGPGLRKGDPPVVYKPQDFHAWYGTQGLDVNNLPTNFGGYDLRPRDPAEARGVIEMQGGRRGTLSPDGTLTPSTGGAGGP